MKTTLSQRVKKILEYKNLTYEQLGKSIGVGKASVYQWVDGRSEPAAPKKIKLLEVYPDINPRWFLFGTGKMNDDVEIEETEDNGVNISKDSPIYRLISKWDENADKLAESREHIIKTQANYIEALKSSIRDKENEIRELKVKYGETSK